VDRQRIVIAAERPTGEDVAVDTTLRPSAAHTVAMVAFDGHQLLDLAGPADVFAAATLLGAQPPYEVVVATPGARPARSISGVVVAPDMGTGDLATSAVDTLMIVGGLDLDAPARDAHLLADLRAASRRTTRTTSVCTGALLLAAAGLLDGYQATTHWASCDELARLHPQVTVLEDRIHVRDRDRWTSAGVTAGIDLALALVEADHGVELAHQVAAWLVVFVRRPGGQSQFSSQLRARPARRQELRDLQRWVPDHLTDDLSIAALARRAGMSERTFVRAWRQETGTTPAAYVESVRLEAARRLLESTDLTVDAVARAAGFSRAEQLHRAVRRRLGTTPASYREHFAHH
jgi:transcriptional regulator GlxA family with amidase domain